MSKKTDTDKLKNIPIIEDNRDKDNKSESLIISNYEFLDKVIDKKEIEQRLQEQQEKLHNPFYSIDLNTNKVKHNIQATFILSTKKTIHNISYTEDIDNALHNDYLKLMQKYDNVLNDFIDKQYNSKDELDKDIVQFNIYYDTNYYNGFNLRVKDFLDKDIKRFYVNQYASAIATLQLQEINSKYKDIKDILDVDIDNIDADSIINQKWFKETQKIVKDYYKDASDKADKQDIDRVIFNVITEMIYQEQIKLLDEIIQKNIDYYKKVNKLYKTINDKILRIVNNFNKYIDKTADLTKLEDIDSTAVIKRDNTKLPKTYTIDFDIMRLFNNIYPNYKFKSIDDNRHKDLDIKAKLLLDINSDTTDEITLFQNMRLVQFIKSGNITLYPIQSALINGFIDIRDNQDTIDKVIPFQSTLKHITQDKKMRFPKSKKDIQLYEDFMLFFDRCKIQVKIIDRATNSVVFEVMQPIPLLSNTQAYSNSSGMGYIIGNSIINILKNELDNLHTTPHQTSLKTSKGYLTSKLPKTPTTINLTQYIDSRISQMINSYNKRGTYNGKVNIETLYDFQALYNKHPKPTKDDRDKVREMLNKYLDEKKSIGLISNYNAIDDKKEITQYKIEINKNNK